MITAAKSKRFSNLFYSYLKYYLLHKHFHNVYVEGDIDEDNQFPIIYIANHSSWWDGLLLFYVTKQQSNRDHYIMMDQQGLEQYGFFRELGAYSINRYQPKAIVQALQYSEQLIQDHKAVWLFPQGEIQHQDIRPYQFQSGLGYLIQRFEQVRVKPVTFHYYFDEPQKPIASIQFGEAILMNGKAHTRKEWTVYLEKVLQQQADTHRLAVINKKQKHQYPVMRQSKSTSDRLDALKNGVKKWTPFSS
ncbi:hypothetical protein Pryu01_01931 [Paraliobacillus ryukyuensis]|uniref:1-acyl-sn-glycerol-3-phosphate acyltransferase n=1 Tax=Paraliobacillus ryukyuensis TaxID=200904 RepID=A0A366E182_9BACI|nr:lysophospholipid acyltransferase family protein [Paraliobacillus ryukyuensis]RBO95198.1 1-acyl-sn-glycerol-3-phosphate acyltransferase [Paraliobacillus ryukyuensis]